MSLSCAWWRGAVEHAVKAAAASITAGNRKFFMMCVRANCGKWEGFCRPVSLRFPKLACGLLLAKVGFNAFCTGRTVLIFVQLSDRFGFRHFLHLDVD